MIRWISRILTVIIVLLAVLIIVLVSGRFLLVPRSFAQTDGTLTLPGLEGQVDVYRDPFGVPHIYASSEHDLFMAQGFLHAQDRFWQMDFWRHLGSGRLSEMFGESQLETDQFLRTLGWARVVEQELEAIDPQGLAGLEAYAQGVNAYLAGRDELDLSLEYVVLGFLNRAYEPEPWQPLHSLTWAKAMAFDLGGNMDSEIRRAVLTRKLGSERVSDLDPEYPLEHPVIVTSTRAQANPSQQLAADTDIPYTSQLEEIFTQSMALHELLGGNGIGIGSNSWVISGERTTTGSPILANDTHLGIQMPSIWYENGLHCEPISETCRYNVVGFSFAGLPSVIIGHNDRIAWGVTNLGPDVQDLYLERINPENPNQYEVNGQWVDMILVEESIEVAGSDPVPITIRYTRHGPILSDVNEDLQALAEVEDAPEYNIGVSLRWTALDPGTLLKSIRAINLASNWDDFRNALRDWDVPSQNFVYADVDGNIGYQAPGRIPIRRSGDGRVPVPGWIDDFEWTGFIPFDQLPSVFNPPEGFIATANNAVVGERYTHFLSSEWDYGYRANRIVEMIEAKPTLSIDDVRRMHGDNYNAMGPVLAPIVMKLEFNELRLAERAALLNGWDYKNDIDSAPAALFNAFWRHLTLRTFADDLPEGWLPGGGTAFRIFSELVNEPNSPWWDDLTTQAVEEMDDIFRAALADAVNELESLLGTDPNDWAWGRLHVANFVNQTLGRSGIAPIEMLFNRGPFETAGGAAIVNATSWDEESGYGVSSLPSQRLIVDLSDLGNSLSMHTTGQSGHVFDPHYIDMADSWRNNQYHPLLWTREQVEALSDSHLILRP
jgi:penicillin amidase